MGIFSRPSASETKRPSTDERKRLFSASHFTSGGKTGAADGARYHGTTPLESMFQIEGDVLAACQNGEVTMAFDKRGKPFAVKSIEKELCSEEHNEFLRREVQIHMSLNHPHILRLWHVFESDEKLELVTELMSGGELYDKIVQQGVLAEKEAASIAFQILLAVSYLHERKIIHRDLKPENILFTDDDSNHLKVIDFGMAITWDGKNGVSHRCGTPCYYAPEMWTSDFTDKIDIWAVGLMVYEMLTGHSAYAGSKRNMMQRVKRGEVYYGSRFAALSLEAQDFIQSLLTVDPQKRPSASVCMRHPWFYVHDSPRAHEGAADMVHHMHCKRLCLEMLAAEFDVPDEEENFQGGDCAEQGKTNGWGCSESTTATLEAGEQRASTISSDGWDEEYIESAQLVDDAEPEDIEAAQHAIDSQPDGAAPNGRETAQPPFEAKLLPPAQTGTSRCWAWLRPCAKLVPCA